MSSGIGATACEDRPNFVIVPDNTDNAGNNTGIINVAIFPGENQGNCAGPACFNFLGTQFFGG